MPVFFFNMKNSKRKKLHARIMRKHLSGRKTVNITFKPCTVRRLKSTDICAHCSLSHAIKEGMKRHMKKHTPVLLPPNLPLSNMYLTLIYACCMLILHIVIFWVIWLMAKTGNVIRLQQHCQCQLDHICALTPGHIVDASYFI